MGWAKYFEDNLELALEREPLIIEQEHPSFDVPKHHTQKEITVTVKINSSKKDNEATTIINTTRKHLNAKELYCQDCGNMFLFSEKAQAIFKDNGWAQPKRCSPCRSTNQMRHLMRAS